ncbi:MAG: glycoside hydrolase family 20 zincin-like fold domain-containing protein [Armatimonadota bacterium]
MPELLPTPQYMSPMGIDGSLRIDQIKSYVLERDSIKAVTGVEQLNAALKTKRIAPIPKSTAAKQPGTPGTLWLGVKPSAKLDNMFTGMPVPQEQGYRLMVGIDWVVIQGKDVQGLYYGLMTMMQLVQSDGSVPMLKISDWPELKLRGTYICDANPEQKIEYFASMKLNFIVFEYPELYMLDNPTANVRWRKIAEECRKHFIEPIPELQSFGHGNAVLSIEPRCAEAVPLTKLPVMARNGAVQIPDTVSPALPLSNPGFEQSDRGKPVGWEYDNQIGGVMVDQTVKHDGTGSLRISRSSSGVLRAWQTVPCQPHRIYDFSSFVKTQDVKATRDTVVGACIEVYGIKEDGGLSPAPLRYSNNLVGTNDWTKLSGKFFTDGYTQVRVYIRMQDASGTIWFDEVAVTAVSHDTRRLTGLIAGPVVLTDKTGRITYEEGRDFKILAPTIMKGTSSSSLVITSYSRIKNREELLLSFDAIYEGSTTCCPSEPLYRNLMRKSIHNVIKCMKPKYLHIGHDEPQVLNQDARCKARHMSNIELVADDIIRMRQYMLEADPHCRMMMWDDALNPYSNAPIFHLEKTAERLPKDIIMNAWAYRYPSDNEKIKKSIDFWLKQGFDITGSPWFDKNNCRFWAEQLIKHKSNRHILGLFYTAWMDLPEKRWDGLTTAAQSSWAGVKPSDW